MEVKEALTKARDLLSDPKRWAKGYYAYNAEGNACFATDRAAVCWCMRGAVRRVADVADDPSRVYLDTMAHLELFLEAQQEGPLDPPVYVHNLNDAVETTHEDVLRFLDAAIDGYA